MQQTATQSPQAAAASFDSQMQNLNSRSGTEESSSCSTVAVQVVLAAEEAVANFAELEEEAEHREAQEQASLSATISSIQASLSASATSMQASLTATSMRPSPLRIEEMVEEGEEVETPDSEEGRASEGDGDEEGEEEGEDDDDVWSPRSASVRVASAASAAVAAAAVQEVERLRVELAERDRRIAAMMLGRSATD